MTGLEANMLLLFPLLAFFLLLNGWKLPLLLDSWKL